MRLTIRPERPSGPYFTSSTLSLCAAQNSRRYRLVDTGKRALHAALSPHENALEHALNQRIVERGIGRRTVDPRDRLALLDRRRAVVVGDVTELEGRTLGPVDLEACDAHERAGRRGRRRDLHRLVLEKGKRSADPPLIQGAARPPVGERRGLMQVDLGTRGRSVGASHAGIGGFDAGPRVPAQMLVYGGHILEIGDKQQYPRLLRRNALFLRLDGERKQSRYDESHHRAHFPLPLLVLEQG